MTNLPRMLFFSFTLAFSLASAGCFFVPEDEPDSDQEKNDDDESSSSRRDYKIDPPKVEIDNSGVATWYQVSAVGYVYNLNGKDSEQLGTKTEERRVQMKEGDTIKVKAIAYKPEESSDWSAPQTYVKANYDFAGIGLPDVCYNYLVSAQNMAPGNYDIDEDSFYKAQNGDVLFGDIEGRMYIFSSANGYRFFETHHNYSDDLTSDYKETDYRDNKLAYYQNWCLMIGPVFSMVENYLKDPEGAYSLLVTPSSDTKAYANYDDFLTTKGKTFLPKEVIDPQVVTSFELQEHTEFSGSGYKNYLNTQYMQKRDVSFLDSLESKIKSWTVTYCNFGQQYYYTDTEFTVNFVDDMADDDILAMRSALSQAGVTWEMADLTPELKAQMEENGLDVSLYESMLLGGGSGKRLIYQYKCTEDDIEDYEDDYVYQHIGYGDIQAHLLKVTYINRIWYDGGCFGWAAFERSGFHRYLPDDNGGYNDLLLVPANQ